LRLVERDVIGPGVFFIALPGFHNLKILPRLKYGKVWNICRIDAAWRNFLFSRIRGWLFRGQLNSDCQQHQ
jgi:hypothetical protein